MCGIAGYVLRRPAVGPQRGAADLLRGIRPRGPDDAGVTLWHRDQDHVAHYRVDGTVEPVARRLPALADPEARIGHDVALVHARYAVIDPSPAAHQPFVSGDGTVIVAFHGEIYNYVELGEELERGGLHLRTASDTEVLAEGYRRWGDEVWPRMNGFWAACVLDLRSGTLRLCRDRMGVAPLYLRETSEGLWWASNFHALSAVPPGPEETDRGAVAGFIRTGLKDFDDATCYRAIRSAPPAAVLAIDRGRVEPVSHTFWELPSDRWTERDLTLESATERYRDAFLDAVRIRLRSDIPVAFELSGGLDSSSIVAAAAQYLSGPLSTYTVAVPEQDEESFARALLDRYDLEFRVLDDPQPSFIEDARAFGRIVQEPYHSPNIYSHYRVRRRMKADGFGVALSGSGGDETLAGYEHDFWPAAAKELRESGRGRHAWRHEWRSDATGPVRAILGAVRRRAGVSPPSRPAAGAAGSDAERILRGYDDLSYAGRRAFHIRVGRLPYYLLSNDHFTMAIPVEHRLPFMDYRLVELGLRLPVSYLFRDGWTKFVHRRALEPLLPASVVWRRGKMGFPFPILRFLRDHQESLAPRLVAPRLAGLIAGPKPDYPGLMRSDPMRLWRLCSTAMWFDGGGCDGD